MDRCSYFIENKALFGSSPSQETVVQLEDIGVRYFIDLTYKNERNIYSYTTQYTKINYPIIDRYIPTELISFSSLILKICNIIKNLQNNEKIYIHCKGGHGRSGIVVACVLCIYLKISPELALELTKKYHRNRHTMNEKWRIIGSPQTDKQKDFVRTFFKPIYFNNSYLNNASPYPISIKDIGIFPTAESAYQYHKNPTDKEYIISQLNSKSSEESKHLGKNTLLAVDNWKDFRVSVMEKILKQKFNQYPRLKSKLMSTCLKPIILCTNKKTFWTNMEYNMFGKILQKIRNEYIIDLNP